MFGSAVCIDFTRNYADLLSAVIHSIPAPAPPPDLRRLLHDHEAGALEVLHKPLSEATPNNYRVKVAWRKWYNSTRGGRCRL